LGSDVQEKVDDGRVACQLLVVFDEISEVYVTRDPKTDLWVSN